MQESPIPPELEKALSSSGWGRRLACRLAQDEASAGDLIQEAWGAALASPPRNAGAHRGWIRSVLRNLSGLARRSQKRRESRERAAAKPEAVPNASAMLERVELQAHVTKAVLSLREPYRTVVILRFFEELTPEQIAQHLEVPSSSIRTQLQRAMAQLRTQLDGNYGSDRSAWCAVALTASGGLAASTAGLVAAQSASVAGVNTLSQFIAWVLIMSAKKAALVGAAVILVTGICVATWLAESDRPVKTHGPQPKIAQPTAVAGDLHPADMRTPIVTAEYEEKPGHPLERPSKPKRAAVQNQARVARVKGRLVATGLGPVTDGRIFLWGYDQAGSRLNDEGEFVIETNREDARGMFYAVNGAKIALAKEVRPSFERDTVVLVEVDPGFSFRGQVVSAATGKTLPGVSMTLRSTSRDTQTQAEAVFIASGPGGEFLVPLIPKGEYRLELSHEGYSPTTLAVSIPKQSTLLAKMELARPFEITLANWEDWKDQERINIQMFCRESSPKEASKKRIPTENVFLKGQPNEHGYLKLAAPRPGSWQYDLFAGSGFPRQRGTLVIPEGDKPVKLSIQLPRVGHTVLEGRVLDGAGAPVSNGVILVERSRARLSDDGTYRLTQISPGKHDVSLSFGAAHNRKVEYRLTQWDIPDEAFVARDLQLEGTATINVQLLDVPNELRSEDPIIHLKRDGAPRHQYAYSISHPDKTTGFRFLPPGMYTISPEFHGKARLTPRKVEIQHEGQVVEISFKMEARVSKIIQLLTPAGIPLPKKVRLVSPPSNATKSQEQTLHDLSKAEIRSTLGVGDTGLIDVLAFSPGKHQVELRARGFRTQVFDLVVGDKSQQVFTLILQPR